MVFGYARFSSDGQNLERQVQAIKAYRPDIPDNNIFQDKKSGKDFEREQYQLMKQIILRTAQGSEPVELVIEEFDRLGRNKAQVKEELADFRKMGVIVRILNIPTTLMDISDQNSRAILDMVQTILIEVLATIAETELEFRKKRQREGITVAKANGVYKGRKPIAVDDKQFEDVYRRWRDGKLKAKEAMKLLGLKPNTFYRRVREYESELIDF